MAGLKVSGGGRALNYVAKVDVSQALKDTEKLRKAIGDVYKVGDTQGGFSTKPLTEYQAELLKIKQQAIDLAKDKAAQAAADKSASLVLQDSLKAERLEREKINTQIANNRLAQQQSNAEARAAADLAKQVSSQKRPTQFSNTQAEIDAYTKAKQGSILYTSAVNNETVARSRLNAVAAAQAAANNTLSLAGSNYVAATNAQTTATNTAVLSKKQLAQMLAEEKYRQQQSTAELKNNAREMLNAKGSLEQRKAALERLTIAYGRLSVAERDSAAGTRMANIIKGVKDQVKELEDQTKSSKGGISGLFDSIKSTVLNTLGPLALLTAAWSALKAAFSHNVEISDAFVDVQRTAKLSADEVDRLGEQLKKLNTRTPLEGLLDIGFIGGRLGVAKEDLVGFIQQVDELSVVLKKEFPGGAEAVATSLGKIVSVYKITQREGLTLQDAMRKVGSAFLELSHNGGAPVQYLQDFALGTAGIAQVVKLSLPTLLSYGSVLSKAGIQASTAATGVTRFLSDLSTKRDKYFAIAQLADSTLTIEKFTNLINTDAKAALELFFKGLKAGNPTTTETGDRLKTLSLTAGRVKNTVIALSEAQDQLFDSTKVVNKAYEDGTSIAHNFELANNSLSAALDKIGNSIANSFTSSSFSRRLAELLNGITDNRTEAEKLGDAYTDNKHQLDELEASLKPVVTRYDELKAKTKLNSTEQEELRKVTALIGELLPSVTTKFDSYGNAIDINRGKVEQLTKAQRDLLELQNRDALKKANSQFNNADAALAIAKSEAANEASRPRDAIDKFQDLFGGDIKKQRVQTTKDNITELSATQYEAAKAVRALGGELTKAQKQVIAYYEVLNKPKPKKQEATILGTGDANDEIEVPRTTEVIKAEIKALQEADKKLAVTSDSFKSNIAKIKELRKELKIALNGGVDPDTAKDQTKYNTALKSRNELQKSIDNLVAKGTNKQLSSDDEELESTKKLYRDKLAEAVQYNKEQAKLDEAAIKAGQKPKRLRVDGGGILQAGSRAEDAVRDKQATEKLKVTLDDQKKLYDDYEAYKLKVGEDNANKLYKDQADKTYLQYLNSKKQQLENGDDKAKGGSDVNKAAVQLQLKLVDQQIAAEVAANKKKDAEIYADAYQAALTNSQALLAIETDYQNKVKALGKDATAEQLENLKRQRDEKVRNENEANADQVSGYAELLRHLDEMTRGKAIEALEAAKASFTDQYKHNLITAQYYSDRINEINQKEDEITGNNIFNGISKSIKRYKEAKDAFDKATGADKKPAAIAVDKARADMFNTIATDADAAAAAISGLGDIFDQLSIGSQGLQDAIKGISGVLSGAGELAKGLSAKDPVAIVTGSVKILTSAISLFSHKDKDLQKSIDGYQKQLNTLTAAYKQLDRQVQSAAGNDIYTDQAAQIANLQLQQAKLTQMRDAEADKKKKDQSKIDDYNNQIADIPNQIEDINKAISQNLIQGTFRDLSNSLSDALTNAFQAGEDGIAAMDKSFDEFIGNAIKNSLKLAIFDKDVKEFTDQLTEFAKANNNSVVGFDFDAWKKKFDADGAAYNAGLAASSQFFPKTGDAATVDDTNSARGQLAASLTEDTGTRIYGVLAGTQTGVLQVRDILTAGLAGASLGDIYKIAQASFDVAVQTEKNTRRGADNTDGLIPALKEIIANTKGTSMRGAGLG